MANPYYIPPSDNNLLDIGKMALQLGSLKQQGDIASRSVELTQNEQNMRKMALLGDTSQGIQGSLISDQQLAEASTLNAQTNKRQAEIAATKISASEKNYNNINQLHSSLVMNGLKDPKNIAFYQVSEKLSLDPTMTRGKAADYMYQNWDVIQKQTIEGLRDEARKLTNKMAKTNPGSIEHDDLMKQIDQMTTYQNSFSKITKDLVKPTFFYDVAQEEALLQSEIAKNTAEKAVSLQNITEERSDEKGRKYKQAYLFNPATGEKTPTGKPYLSDVPKPEKLEKLNLSDVKSAYSMDMSNIKNQMMVDMTPEEQIQVSSQPVENVFALLMSGKIGKSLSPEKKQHYVGRLKQVESYYGGLTNQVLGRKGVKAPDIPKKPISQKQEIFKDKQGREMVRDTTSRTGWRYK